MQHMHNISNLATTKGTTFHLIRPWWSPQSHLKCGLRWKAGTAAVPKQTNEQHTNWNGVYWKYLLKWNYLYIYICQNMYNHFHEHKLKLEMINMWEYRTNHTNDQKHTWSTYWNDVFLWNSKATLECQQHPSVLGYSWHILASKGQMLKKRTHVPPRKCAKPSKAWLFVWVYFIILAKTC